MADNDKNIMFDSSYLISKIEDFEQKILEQKKIQSNLEEFQEEHSEDIMAKEESDNFEEDREKKIENLKEEIHIISLYKQSLESEISEYKNNLKNNEEIKKSTLRMKEEILNLQKEREILVINCIKLHRILERYEEIRNEIKTKLPNQLEKLNKLANYGEEMKKSILTMKTEIEFLNKSRDILLSEKSDYERDLVAIKQKIEEIKSLKTNI